MAKTPTGPTPSEVAIDLAGFKASVDQQFKSLTTSVDQQFKSLTTLVTEKIESLSKLVWWMVGIIVLIIGSGGLLYRESGEVKGELGKVGVQITALREDISRIEKRFATPVPANDATTQQSLAQMNLTLRRIEEKLSGPPSPIELSLTDAERDIIRSFLGLNKGPPKVRAKYQIGEAYSGAVNEFPNELVGKLTKLKGFKFAYDPNNGSALIISADNRVVAIVEQA